jgi:hypothetical protein
MATELRRRSDPKWEVEGMLGHAAGITEGYAVFDPEYMSMARPKIDAYFAELGLIYTVPKPDCVPLACQPNEAEFSRNEDLPAIFKGFMVGGTGIEPVTPTMSR